MARILVVEDEPTIAIGLLDDLQLEGHVVDLVADGPAAERAALARQHDLILLDVMLPGKDGLAVCQTLRARGISTPVILLTARGQEADKVRGLQIGADDYVTKPFSPRELLARIQAVLRRAVDGRGTEVVRVGDLTIDFARHEARRGSRVLALTATEFKLLGVFVRYRGRVISHDQLIAEAWGRDVFLTDRVIYTHVNNLRQKIEPDPSHPSILVGVRGVGYRLDA